MTALPKCFGIIPARYQSTRFPGKALADINGKPMIWHVYTQAAKCNDLSSVVLATDDERIRSEADKWEIPVVMTRTDHHSGTDRVLEAAAKISVPADAVVVNIQGDEPALDPAMIAELLRPFSKQDAQAATLAREINTAEAANPDIVKVVFNGDGRALYFSRSLIPHHRSLREHRYYGHIGIYAFRMTTLKKFVTLRPSRLEITEKLEQLRLLENNFPIHIVLTKHQSIGVDRPEDIETVSRIIRAKKTRI